jgi:hypothetical protein
MKENRHTSRERFSYSDPSTRREQTARGGRANGFPILIPTRDANELPVAVARTVFLF